MSGPPAQETIKHIVDYTAVGVAGMTWLEMLPHISAALAIIWFVIRIYESETVQKIVKKLLAGRKRG